MTPLATAKKRLPGATFVNISDDCLQMQIRKTPEEIALCQRAYRYFDKIHAFSRDFILERGTKTTDFEIGEAIQSGLSHGVNEALTFGRFEGALHAFNEVVEQRLG